MPLPDEFGLRGRPMLVNLVLRGNPALDGTGRYIAFGFALNLPPDLMKRSNGKDIHLLAKVYIDGVEAGTQVLEHTWNESPEDIIEEFPIFKKEG